MIHEYLLEAEFKFTKFSSLTVSIRITVASKSTLYAEGNILYLQFYRQGYKPLRAFAVIREITLFKQTEEEPERLVIVANINVRSPFSIRVRQEIPKAEDEEEYGFILQYRIHENSVNEA